MDGWMEKVDGLWVDVGWMDGKCGWMDGQANGWREWWMDGWIRDGGKGGWIDG